MWFYLIDEKIREISGHWTVGAYVFGILDVGEGNLFKKNKVLVRLMWFCSKNKNSILWVCLVDEKTRENFSDWKLQNYLDVVNEKT